MDAYVPPLIFMPSLHGNHRAEKERNYTAFGLPLTHQVK